MITLLVFNLYEIFFDGKTTILTKLKIISFNKFSHLFLKLISKKLLNFEVFVSLTIIFTFLDKKKFKKKIIIPK